MALADDFISERGLFSSLMEQFYRCLSRRVSSASLTSRILFGLDAADSGKVPGRGIHGSCAVDGLTNEKSDGGRGGRTIMGVAAREAAREACDGSAYIVSR